MANNVLKVLNLLVAVNFLSAGTAAHYPPNIQPANGKPPVDDNSPHLQSLEKETLPLIEPCLLNATTFLGKSLSGVVKRKLDEKKDDMKKKKQKTQMKKESSNTKTVEKKIKKVPLSYKPKPIKKVVPKPLPKVVPKPQPSKKAPTKKVPLSYKPKTIKKKVVPKPLPKVVPKPQPSKKAPTKYKTTKPAITSYIPKGKPRMNPIDACWRNDPNWSKNRMHLADCAVGYGFDAMGGKGGEIYVVTDPSDNPTSPKPGTLRYGVVQMRPLWIIFDHDMSIKLQNELIITSYKTIDGRGAKVEIAHGPCLTIQFVDHVIIHGLSIHHCTPGKAGRVMSSTDHVGERQGSDGDAISIFGSSHIWIDHNYFASCTDGLVDAIHSSTAITVSNSFFTDHDKVMLLGHSDSYSADKDMRVTLVYNHFGPGLIQRMPRCRFGYFHVANNRYTQWGMYAIGASANPTIKSEGNYFLAPNDSRFKQVVKLEGARKTSSSNWRSNGDLFLNGAYFGEVGTSTYNPSYKGPQENFEILPAAIVPFITADAGPLDCNANSRC